VDTWVTKAYSPSRCLGIPLEGHSLARAFRCPPPTGHEGITRRCHAELSQGNCECVVPGALSCVSCVEGGIVGRGSGRRWGRGVGHCGDLSSDHIAGLLVTATRRQLPNVDVANQWNYLVPVSDRIRPHQKISTYPSVRRLSWKCRLIPACFRYAHAARGCAPSIHTPVIGIIREVGP
jgi:hypothetical protein